MENRRDARATTATTDTTPGEKREWRAPLVTEIDFSATEANFFGFGGDAGLYS